MLKTLEHHEHAGHIAHGGKHDGGEHGSGGHGGGHGGGDGHGADHAAAPAKSVNPRLSALLVAVLAAGLALSEQGAKHGEIKIEANMIAGADAWAQYQAKSTRSTITLDVARMLETMDPPASAEVADRRRKMIETLNADQERFERDPHDGKEAIAHRAHEFEHLRDYSLEQTHAYHNASAAMELGIVLATASAIMGSRMLIYISMSMGVIGTLCALAGLFKPEWGAF